MLLIALKDLWRVADNTGYTTKSGFVCDIIVDRLSNTYQTDLPRKVDFVDEVESWKIRWALVDDN
jgi:hypothetical protein